MSTKELVKIVIPIYKTNLSDKEVVSLKNTLNVLKNHRFVFVVPENLDYSTLIAQFNLENHQFIGFPDFYFKGLDGYNQLLLSELFYSKFIDTHYILICQTDVLIFRDELVKWCEKGYDYIGAPWIASNRNIINMGLMKFNNFIRKIKGKKLKFIDHYFKVGNGGLSLRKVDSHLQIIQNHQGKIKYYQQNKQKTDLYIEDLFWSLVAPTLNQNFKIPDYKEAVGFAIDRKPKKAMALNQNLLPFGCHGFNKPKVWEFWKPYFLEIQSKLN